MGAVQDSSNEVSGESGAVHTDLGEVAGMEHPAMLNWLLVIEMIPMRTEYLKGTGSE